MMTPLPFVLEDRTGLLTGSDFDDIYDRVFLRIARVPQPKDSTFTTMIYKMAHRSSRRRDTLPFHSNPSVVLEFGPQETLGNISYVGQWAIPMSRYLRKTSLFGGSVAVILFYFITVLLQTVISQIFVEKIYCI
jgi:hypothetical protein